MSEQIRDIFAMNGAPTTTSGNDPLPLVDPGAVWLVTKGQVDIVAMTIGRQQDVADVDRRHLLRIGEGELLFGFRAPPAGHNVLLLGYGVGDAEVTRISVPQLARAMQSNGHVASETASLVDSWVAAVCSLCAGDLAPMGAHNLRVGARCDLCDGQSAQPMGGVIWLRPEGGAARFMGQDDAGRIEGDILFPAGHEAWLTAEGDCALIGLAGAECVQSEAYWRGLSAFQNTVETVIDLQRTHERDAEQRRLAAKSEASRSDLVTALGHLESILHRRRRSLLGAPGESDLLSACRMVVRPLGLEIVDPGTSDQRRTTNPLEAIARASRCSVRRVRLASGWHRTDAGPLLGFLRGGDVPVALLPRNPRTYELHNVVDGTVRVVDDAVAREIEAVGFMFYRSLPVRPLKGLDLFRFACRGIRRDVATVLGVGAAGGVLTLATPLAIGHVFDTLIPGAEQGRLVQVMIALIVAAFAATAFQITRNIALIRMQHRSGNALQAAIWDRVVNLPVKFFRNYTAGDLGVRAMGIEKIMDELSTSVITTIVSSLFSVFAVALLFYYDATVAVAALALVAVVVLVTIVCGAIQVRYERLLEESNGKMAGMLLQFMNGIAKVRIAAAEDRAFAQWAMRFAEQTRYALGSRIVSNNLDVFTASFPVLTYMTIFFLMASTRQAGDDGVSTGSFLAFISAFATFFYGMLRSGSTAVSVMTLAPIYGRLRPILNAEPEIDESKADPGLLRGRIEVSNVSFRYEPNGPLILEDVSLSAEPGQFIALVGPSGSGKSTLLRILLGFERPDSGAIAFDGADVSGLDLRALRRQLGVVLQDGALLPGDVFTNIVGSAVDLTQADAWEAARRAGLDQDIEQLPMGMHTVISEGAGTLSGGQRQRLMIARALVTKPRVVFFDEATSALDNPTQAIVTESLDRLRATRVVIAHRLSTIINADRIFVMDQGRIVQQGRYDELVDQPGMFHELVKRQMA